MPKQTIYTFKQFLERHAFLTKGGLRWAIFNAKKNGLAASKAILRNGYRILIDEPKFLAWLNKRQQSS